jgi:2-polyprenyl-6-hydroxyphenyl methylase / 3-demethylubiquinone-9 3-methyltransferase
MTTDNSTIDTQEVSKFTKLADFWWDLHGPLKTLHDINPTRVEYIQQHCALDGLKILDVGCGGGILSVALAKAGAIVTGIDADSEAIKAATVYAEENHLPIDYVCTPIEDYEHEGFDAIVCMELLEHVHDPLLVLKHCRRLLKPGGKLFLSTISRTLKAYASVIIAAEYVLNLLPKQTHDYKKFIKPSELIAMGREAGFDLEDLSGLHYNPLSRQASLTADVSANYLLILN